MKTIGKRMPNIECLRCIAMFFIVLNHCILNLATNEYKLNNNPINFCITDFVYQVVYNGVNVFVLISGYFLVKTTRETTNWEKVIKLWLSAFFYSVSIYVTLIVLHYVCWIHTFAWGGQWPHTRMETTCRDYIHNNLFPIIYNKLSCQWK